MGIVNDKRLNIILTAERLFALRGYESTGIREIGRNAGISPAMINHYFGSKDMLVKAIIDYRTIVVFRESENIKHKSKPLIRLHQFIENYLKKMSEHIYFYLLVTDSIGRSEAVLPTYYEDFRKIWSNGFEKIINDGQNMGTFRQDIDVAIFKVIVQGAINQIIIDSNIIHPTLQPEETGLAYPINDRLDLAITALKKVVTIMVSC